MGRGAVIAELVTAILGLMLVFCFPDFAAISGTSEAAANIEQVVNCFVAAFVPSTVGGVVITLVLEVLKAR